MAWGQICQPAIHHDQQQQQQQPDPVYSVHMAPQRLRLNSPDPAPQHGQLTAEAGFTSNSKALIVRRTGYFQYCDSVEQEVVVSEEDGFI